MQQSNNLWHIQKPSVIVDDFASFAYFLFFLKKKNLNLKKMYVKTSTLIDFVIRSF